MSGATIVYSKDNETIVGGLTVVGYQNVRINFCHIDNLIIRNCENVLVSNCLIDNFTIVNCFNYTISESVIESIDTDGVGGSIILTGNRGIENNYPELPGDKINKNEIEIKGGLLTGSWHFYNGKPTYKQYRGNRCSNCDTMLYTRYIYVIEKLKEADLLDKNYPYLCCNCFKKRFDENDV